jgi:hypothetical protein
MCSFGGEVIRRYAQANPEAGLFKAGLVHRKNAGDGA